MYESPKRFHDMVVSRSAEDIKRQACSLTHLSCNGDKFNTACERDSWFGLQSLYDASGIT